MLLCKENYERALCSLIVDTSGTVIVGYEYTYDDLGRILSEIHLAKNIKYDYTYDSLSRVTKRTLTNLSDNTTSEEVYAYDNAGNITSCTVSNGANTFVYDQNNRLISYNGQAVTYDIDGNMLSATLNGAQMSFVYDSANRLISAGQNSYTYNVEDVRVRNLCGESETTYAYNTNGRLSQLLVKTTDGVITKYVYGLGLIGEEKNGEFKTYHFDFRGSTVAITDSCGNITDTFKYDTYGRLVSRTGDSFVIFGYNGRDGVVTDRNGLLYMRARYYSPDMRRFINADIIPGEISNAVTLNRYAYANGNPVSNIDPFGLSAERGNKKNWYGAAYLEQYSVETINKDLLNILGLIKVSYTQTVTTTKVHGTQGEVFGAYAYTNVSYDNISYGAGVDLFYLIGLDVNVKHLGLEVKGSLHLGNTDINISGEVNVLDYTSIAIGMTQQIDDTTQIEHKYSIEGNTFAVASVVVFVVTGAPLPNGLPVRQPA